MCAAVALACAVAFAWPLLAQDKPAPKPDKAAGDKKDEPVKPAEDEGYGLLAELEAKRGPTFAGKDPAFLVLPRRKERSNMAYELLGGFRRRLFRHAVRV